MAVWECLFNPSSKSFLKAFHSMDRPVSIKPVSARRRGEVVKGVVMVAVLWGFRIGIHFIFNAGQLLLLDSSLRMLITIIKNRAI